MFDYIGNAVLFGSHSINHRKKKWKRVIQAVQVLLLIALLATATERASAQVVQPGPREGQWALLTGHVDWYLEDHWLGSHEDTERCDDSVSSGNGYFQLESEDESNPLTVRFCPECRVAWVSGYGLISRIGEIKNLSLTSATSAPPSNGADLNAEVARSEALPYGRDVYALPYASQEGHREIVEPRSRASVSRATHGWDTQGSPRVEGRLRRPVAAALEALGRGRRVPTPCQPEIVAADRRTKPGRLSAC